jgi:chaperonin GroEL
MTDEYRGTSDLTPHAGQVLRGADRFANSVKRMLGPRADFFSRFSSPEPSTEDLIAWGINADDPYEVMGARVLTEAAINTNRLSGGGATTTTILSEFILRESAKLLNGGIDPVDLQHGIELAVKQVVRAVKRQAYKDLTADHSAQVGTVAADGDHEIGLIVGRTVSPQTESGLITIDYMRQATPRVRIESAPDGYKIFVGGVTKDDAERRKARLENAIHSAQAAVEEGVVAGGGASAPTCQQSPGRDDNDQRGSTRGR